LLSRARKYVDTPYVEGKMSELEWKKVSAELLILSLVEARPRHGYEISKLIEQRSNGAVTFYVASLYPLLYRLEKRGWIQGRWVEKSGQRRRRYYRLTSEGQKMLATQRRGWKAFVEAVNRITEAEHA
jgi:PadR family transcriptional regulator PadR